MRLVTRSDFDGLASAILLKETGLVTDYLFAHPKDIQDGRIPVDKNDILANVPYSPGCGIWFDHHSSEFERLGEHSYIGSSKPSPSCARVIWDFFGGYSKFSRFYDPMLHAVDKTDSGMLTMEEIRSPKDWYLLGLVMDPRTGLGRYHDYRISNYQLMRKLIDLGCSHTAGEILADPDVDERVRRYKLQQPEHEAMLLRCSELYGNVLYTDLRYEEEIFTGNRFMIYSLFPKCAVSVLVIWGKQKQNVVITVGHSILNRTSTADIGSLMLSYGGGGHSRVGTCQVSEENAERTIREVVDFLRKA